MTVKNRTKKPNNFCRLFAVSLAVVVEGSYALQLTILCYLSAVCDISGKSFADYGKSLITKYHLGGD